MFCSIFGKINSSFTPLKTSRLKLTILYDFMTLLQSTIIVNNKIMLSHLYSRHVSGFLCRYRYFKQQQKKCACETVDCDGFTKRKDKFLGRYWYSLFNYHPLIVTFLFELPWLFFFVLFFEICLFWQTFIVDFWFERVLTCVCSECQEQNRVTD